MKDRSQRSYKSFSHWRSILLLSGCLLPVFLFMAVCFGNDVFIVFESDKPSRSIGTAANGRLENGKRLPARGENFRAYSCLGTLIGRNAVHHRVRECVLDAYGMMEEKYPHKVFVYGETGRPSGGEFKPHKTHQNGLCVDFMVPVTEEDGGSVPLPASVFNKFGYGMEFDSAGKSNGLRIDFEAMAEHIAALHVSAGRHGLKIRRIIFDPELQPLLFKTPAGKKIKSEISFSKKRSWVRHDEHYHVEFGL